MSNESLKIVMELLKGLDADATHEPKPKKTELPKMRTIPAAVAEVKERDPSTALTVSALRRAVKQGRIPHINVASKTLINLVDVYAFMSSSAAAPERSASINGIRRVD